MLILPIVFDFDKTYTWRKNSNKHRKKNIRAFCLLVNAVPEFRKKREQIIKRGANYSNRLSD